MKSKIIIIFPSIILLLLLLTLYNKLATKDVTLNFYTHDSEIIDQIIDDFEKEHSNIKIEKKIIPPNTNRLEFITNALNNDDIQIDIIDTDIIWVYNLAKNNLITPLDNYFSNKELNDFLSSAINGNIIDNQIYGIPYRTDTGILYYRKDLLKKYNQNIPKTYDDLIKTYNHISSKEEIYGFGGSWQSYEGLTCNALELLWSFGGEINLSEEDINNHTIINTKDNEKAFKEIKNLIDKKITHPDILEFYSGDLREEFIKGNLLFMRDWPAGWNKIQNDELSILKDKVGISYLPLGIIHGNNSGTLGGWPLNFLQIIIIVKN
jgi:ABC-type glycerol-3-phosphate transport system substrate-binding protein